MIDSAIVYLGLALIMMLFAWIGAKSKNYSYLWAGVSSLAFAVVMGIRMHVGIDFDMYLQVYEQTKTGWYGFGYTRWEPAFQLLYYIFASQYIHYSIPFGIIAFLQIFLVFYGLRRQKGAWVYIPLTLMIVGSVFAFNNIMRHMVAFSIFVCAISFLAERKYWKYVLCIVAAACFHKSALILLILPLIYCWCQQVFTKIWIQFVIVAIGLILMNLNYVQQVFEALSIGMVLLGYEGYMDTSFAEFDTDKRFGIAYALIVIANLIIIFNSRRMKKYYDSRVVNIMYDMYIVGLFNRFAFRHMFLIQRLNWYFIGFEFIIAALTLNFFNRKKDWIWFAAWLVLYLAVFAAKLKGKDDGDVLYHAFFEYP